MQTALRALQEELTQRRNRGERWVNLHPQALTALKEKVATLQPAPEPPKLVKSYKKAEPLQISLEDSPSEPTPAAQAAPKAPSNIKPIPAPEPFELPAGSKEEQWNWLRNKVLDCPVCNERLKPGKKVVFGVGSIDADIFFCGEAPGADEEIQGEPFVGKAGQLLTKIIGAMGLQRSDVYIGNIMNWRPEMPTSFGNRPPTAEEMNFCLPYLKAQIQIVQPKVIIALGATAVNGLLGHDSSRRMSQVRGTFMDFEGTPLMITFHPSYLLRNDTQRTKRQVWEDMLQVMERVELPISDKQRGYFS